MGPGEQFKITYYGLEVQTPQLVIAVALSIHSKITYMYKVQGNTG